MSTVCLCREAAALIGARQVTTNVVSPECDGAPMSPPIDDLRALAEEVAAARAEVIGQSAMLAVSADQAASAARAAASLADAAAHAAAKNEEADARERRRSVLGQLAGFDARLAALVAQLPDDPCDVEADVPLALLPVRLETCVRRRGCHVAGADLSRRRPRRPAGSRPL